MSNWAIKHFIPSIRDSVSISIQTQVKCKIIAKYTMKKLAFFLRSFNNSVKNNLKDKVLSKKNWYTSKDKGFNYSGRINSHACAYLIFENAGNKTENKWQKHANHDP